MRAIRSVLIVDDNEDDRALSQRAVRKSGLCETIFTANDGVAAADFLKDHRNREKLAGKFPPTLIFLDLNMPRLDGFGFLDACADALDPADTFVIVALTAPISAAERDRATAHACVIGFINKALRARTLVDELSKFPALA